MAKLHRSVTIDRIMDAMADDDMTGFCTACGEQAYGVEPDAEEYPCEVCGADKVYGAEQLLLMTVA